MHNLNRLEKAAKCLGFELVIEQKDGVWVITENIADAFAFELPITIGNSLNKAYAWMSVNLLGKAGV